MTEPEVLEIALHVAASPETVFAYFTDPDLYVQWMGTEATLDAVAGGCYRVRMRDGVETSGQFEEVDPPRQLVFTWGWAEGQVAPGSTRVVVTFEKEAGGTRVVLRHYDLPDDDQRGGHRKGWDLYLERLRIRLAGGDPGPDPNA